MRVAFNFNDIYTQHFLTTLYGVLKNYKGRVPIHIYILSSDITNESKDLILELTNRFKECSTEFIAVDKNRFDSVSLIDGSGVSIEANYRLLLANLITDVDKILYCDCDILVRGDLSTLYETELRDNYIAGVYDEWADRSNYKRDVLKMKKDEPYINSGVILLNLKKIRDNKMVSKLIEQRRLKYEGRKVGDQDALNVVFKKNILLLPGRFNFCTESFNSQKLYEEAVIIHYTGPTKPWQIKYSDNKYKAEYRHAEKEVYRLLSAKGQHILRLKHLEEAAQSHRMPLVSVIIPIYNVEKYLRDCLDSILNQTYQNTEIILVDDKSPDRSGEIAEEYALKDERIKVIHKPKNEGLNMARATGFKASKGEYITFVDSDDMLTEQSLDVALHTIIKCKSDFVRMKEVEISNNVDVRCALRAQPSHSFEIIHDKAELFKKRLSGGRYVCVWGVIYTRELVEKVDWKKANYRINEDLFWTQQVLSLCDSGAYLQYAGYMYRVDNNSADVLSKKTSGNSFNGQSVGFLEFVERVTEDIKQYNREYNLGLDKEIERYREWLYRDRVERLTIANAWSLENNTEYISNALPYIIKYYQNLKADNNLKQKRIIELTTENDQLKVTLSELHTIKRGGRLFLGNIKRKVRLRTRLRSLLIQKQKDDRSHKLQESLMQRIKSIPNNDNPQYIVSLTSYGDRLKTHAPSAVMSLMAQEKLPDKIILWLAYGEKAPKTLKVLQKKGLEIRFCRDIRSYKKLVPTRELYPGAHIITADDDMIYPPDWYIKLYDTHKKHPKKIVCHRAHEIVLNKNKRPSPYNQWRFTIKRPNNYENIFPTGACGILYPPKSLHQDALVEKLFMSLAPHADDIWFWAMARLRGSKHTIVVDGYIDTYAIAVDPDGEDGLWDKVNATGGNDLVIDKVIEKYPKVLKDLK